MNCIVAIFQLAAILAATWIQGEEEGMRVLLCCILINTLFPPRREEPKA